MNSRITKPQLFTKPETYNPIRPPLEEASTLIPDAYTSNDFFMIEQEKVFANSWVAVGCVQKVYNPGDILVVQVAGRAILIIRDQKLKLRAFYNVCRHRGSKLLEDNCNLKKISNSTNTEMNTAKFFIKITIVKSKKNERYKS